jgi:hypothetical protein
MQRRGFPPDDNLGKAAGLVCSVLMAIETATVVREYAPG